MWMMLGWAPQQTLQACSSAAVGKDTVPMGVGLHHEAFPAESCLRGKAKYPPSPWKRLCPSPSPSERCSIFLTLRGTLSIVGPQGQGETWRVAGTPEEVM